MRERGFLGEKIAAKYLKKAGYTIVDTNYACRMGEIDIIAKEGEYLVFVEVKLRKNDDFGGGAFAVDKRKQERIRRTALHYMQTKHINAFVRFDVVLLYGDGNKFKKEDIEVIRNAFY